MVQFYIHNGVTSQTKMHNGTSKTGRGIAVNGPFVSTPKRQPKPKSTCSRQERGSCSSTASCPVFSGPHSDNDSPPRCPSSLSSPTLRGTGPVSSLKGSILSLPSVKGSVFSLKSFQSSNLSLRSCSPSSGLRSSSSSQRSGGSSEDDSWDTNSWSSGATCLLRSSIKQHSEEVFRTRAGSGSRPEGTSDSETGYRNFEGSVVGPEKAEQFAVGRKDSERSLTSSHGTSSASTASAEFEEKIEAKLKFSQFLDEVTSRVLDPECLQAFGAARQRETASPHTTRRFSMDASWSSSSKDSWVKCMPSCKILDSSETFTSESRDVSQDTRQHEKPNFKPLRWGTKTTSPLHFITKTSREGVRL